MNPEPSLAVHRHSDVDNLVNTLHLRAVGINQINWLVIIFCSGYHVEGYYKWSRGSRFKFDY